LSSLEVENKPKASAPILESLYLRKQAEIARLSACFGRGKMAKSLFGNHYLML
jgi:hypothetical protein